MKIYHVSSAPIDGGAARAGLGLHRGLLQTRNVESLWLNIGGLPDVSCARQIRNGGNESLGSKIRRFIRRRQFQWASGTGTPSSSPCGWGDGKLLAELPTPDVWNLQWVSGFLDWEELLPWMAQKAPIVWTLHDLNPLMGIWHYAPSPGELSEKLMAVERRAIAFKKRALSRIPKNRVVFVAPSRWMADQCRKSPVTEGFAVVHIPYDIDTNTFAPRDRNPVRSMFGISDQFQVLGFASDSINDPRKGMQQLQQAVAALPRCLKLHVLTVGKGRPPELAVPHHHLGSIQGDYLLSFFYSTCDLFVCPSLQDNLPCTILEAFACGTPVIAYAAGGVPDLVKSYENGLLINPVGDEFALSRGIRELLSDSEALARMRKTIRDAAVERYQIGCQASRYYELYVRIRGAQTDGNSWGNLGRDGFDHGIGDCQNKAGSNIGRVVHKVR